MSRETYNVAEHFPVLTPDMAMEARPWTGDMEFYEGLSDHFGGFENHVLISCHAFDAPWPTWECHPKGDEMVLLLSGTATMTTLVDESTRDTRLSAPGDYLIVPRGVWHTASAADQARMLFITPGEGTENRADPNDPQSAL